MKRLFFLLTLLFFTSQTLAEDVHYHLVVGGLSCPFCVYGVEKKLILEAAIQIPVYQDLNGAALENDYVLRAGFRVNY